MRHACALLLLLTALLLGTATASADHRHPEPGDRPGAGQAGSPVQEPEDDLPADVLEELDPDGPGSSPTREEQERPWRFPEPVLPAVPTTTQPVVKGTVAMMRTDGRAAIPRSAPPRVKAILRAANAIIGRPYKWGGGHGRLVDSGYDCSGAVSYALIKARQLGTPLVSGQLARTYAAGAGRWVTIYANRGHVYMEVAGLRLDTSSVGDALGQRGVRWRPVIGRRAGFHERHPVGL